MKKFRLRGFRHESGFTMVEVLVVVAIIGILVATTVPTYLKNRPQRMLSATTNLLMANFNSARVLAIQNNQNVYMEFIPEVDTFRIWDYVGWQRYYSVYATTSQYSNQASILPYSISPVRSYSPLMHVNIYSGIPTIWRNLGSERAIGSEKTIPLEVDIRMNPNTCADQNINESALTARPYGNGIPDRMKHLSRIPLLYLTFHPDGSVSNSWAYPCNSIATEKFAPSAGRHLGVTEIFMQVRGDMNPMLANNYKSDYDRIPIEGIFPNQSLPTMYYENGSPRLLGGNEWEIKGEAMSDSNGRRIIINNSTGRIIVENWAPYNIDVPLVEGDEGFSPDTGATGRKHWL
jgi:prepilin-type N-terminal cleavage/methylation domain-containing protein